MIAEVEGRNPLPATSIALIVTATNTVCEAKARAYINRLPRSTMLSIWTRRAGLAEQLARVASARGVMALAENYATGATGRDPVVCLIIGPNPFNDAHLRWLAARGCSVEQRHGHRNQTLDGCRPPAK